MKRRRNLYGQQRPQRQGKSHLNPLAARETGSYRYIERSESELGAQRIIDSGSFWQRLKARFSKKKDKKE